ncbi:MAG: hypothetical protein KKA36_05090 [Gammaproteobacteria bacterium]|nr:hypothetical protein [Gammaproteobacteria bacterium]MBU2478445.1 hypothetical protein [Gammaproteobacteria bacterium]
MLWKFLEICLLKSGPQDLPAAPRFLALVLTGYFLVDVLVSRLNTGLGTALAISLLDVLLLGIFVSLVLRLVSKPERFNQTLAAMAGTGQLLGLVALPLIHGLSVAQAAGEPAAGLALAWLAVLCWSLLVLGHILRHALGVNLMAGVGIGMLYSLLSLVLMRAVFPAGG